MVKKLHLRLIKAFIGPFLASFAITMFLFLMHFIWLYIDDLIGKGLSSWIIIKLLALTTATLVPMALPLAVLLSSLMAYGNLAEHFEIVAIKSSGISLFKTLWPNFVLIIFLSIGAYFFVNYVIPRAQLESKSLLWDVRQKKPAFNIEEGIFYNEIDGYSIKVARKLEDNETIEDVIIYIQNPASDQISVVKAKSGKMYLSDDKKLLYFTLLDGVRYEEMSDQENYNKTYPSNITAFDKEEMAFDLSTLDLQNTDKELFKSDYRMMSMQELEKNRDSMHKNIRQRNNYQIDYMKNYYRVFDTAQVYDTGYKADAVSYNKDDLLADASKEEKADILLTVKSALNMQNDICENTMSSNEQYLYDIVLYTSEMHKKITLSVLILVLFFIAAPLGTIIRKGGLGMPLVISVVMFIIYYVISIVGEKMAKEEVWNMGVGMWFAIIVFTPIAIFITYKASIDSALFDADWYIRLFRNIKAKMHGNKNTVT